MQKRLRARLKKIFIKKKKNREPCRGARFANCGAKGASEVTRTNQERVARGHNSHVE
ncbi:hypothetical protein PUN28_002795 [Cardiocondyla obscurior]|uniref:Uncharacterized protein n=1 Tax=Cardiocondyla obscurior TaxID=286306 RepID=A0AAW2GWF7_9HYME